MHATPETQTHTLQSLFRAADAKHRQNLCVLALLTWIASCDGTIEDGELALLRNIAAGVAGGEALLPAVIDVAREGRVEDLELACRFIRNQRWVAALPLQMIGPDIRASCRVDQLEIYSQRAVIALDVAGNRVLHAKIRHEARHVHLTIAI